MRFGRFGERGVCFEGLFNIGASVSGDRRIPDGRKLSIVGAVGRDYISKGRARRRPIPASEDGVGLSGSLLDLHIPHFTINFMP